MPTKTKNQHYDLSDFRVSLKYLLNRNIKKAKKANIKNG